MFKGFSKTPVVCTEIFGRSYGARSDVSGYPNGSWKRSEGSLEGRRSRRTVEHTNLNSEKAKRGKKDETIEKAVSYFIIT